jgi:hypothetical protein
MSWPAQNGGLIAMAAVMTGIGIMLPFAGIDARRDLPKQSLAKSAWISRAGTAHSQGSLAEPGKADETATAPAREPEQARRLLGSQASG